ncbi:DUF4131 domain-containing protein, partial [Pseudoxanthomonas sp. SGD-10]
MVSFYKDEIPFFRYLWFFLCGIYVSILGRLEPMPCYYIIWAVVFLSLIIFLVVSKKRKIYHHNWVPGVLIAILFSLSGLIFTNTHKEIFKPRHFSKYPATELIVVIHETPRIKNDIARFTVEVTHTIKDRDSIYATHGKLLLAMRFDTTGRFPFSYGDELLIK